MKKFLSLVLAFMMSFSLSCSKSEKPKTEEPLTIKKYATMRVAVYKDIELSKWLATLEKAEEVTLLSNETIALPDSKTQEISKIQLSDDSVGYVQSRFLGDKPIVFTEDAKLYVRPNITTKVYATVPKGTIGFITDEKANWVEVFIGKLPDGKWIEKKWVNQGFSQDLSLIVDAVSYEKALNLLSDSSKKENIKEAKNILEDLSQKMNVIGEIAQTKLNEIEESEQNITKESGPINAE